MSTITRFIILSVTSLMMANGALYQALADHDGHKEGRRHQKRARNCSEHNGNRDRTTVIHPTYKKECGACHFAYHPDLLPFGSWDKIISGLGEHFGEVIELDPESKKLIAEYLKENAADHCSAKLSIRIMKSLGGTTPKRITEVPYIRKKHHKISAEVFKRESIGSFSNCVACHRAAEKGIFDDDEALIPN